MNKECIYINGNVLVEDEHGVKKEVEYQDNIEEILLQENIIETIVNNKDEVIKKKNKINMKLKSKKSKGSYIFRGVFIICSIISAIMIPQMMFKPDLVNTVFGIFRLKDIATIYLGIIALVFNVGDIISEKIEKERLKKECKYITDELTFLNIQLLEEQEKLTKMKSEKTKKNIPKGLKICKINDKNLLEEVLNEEFKDYEEIGPKLILKR